MPFQKSIAMNSEKLHRMLDWTLYLVFVRHKNRYFLLILHKSNSQILTKEGYLSDKLNNLHKKALASIEYREDIINQLNLLILSTPKTKNESRLAGNKQLLEINEHTPQPPKKDNINVVIKQVESIRKIHMYDELTY
jgi:hypothetical protein